MNNLIKAPKESAWEVESCFLKKGAYEIISNLNEITIIIIDEHSCDASNQVLVYMDYFEERIFKIFEHKYIIEGITN